MPSSYLTTSSVNKQYHVLLSCKGSCPSPATSVPRCFSVSRHWPNSVLAGFFQKTKQEIMWWCVDRTVVSIRQHCTSKSVTAFLVRTSARPVLWWSHTSNIFLVERRRAFTLLHASAQWSEFLVVPLCSKFIKRPSSSQMNITITFLADTLELLFSPSPRVCHKAPFHRLPLEFRFKMVDPGSTRHDNLQQKTLTSSAGLVQKTSGPCFPRQRASF